MQVHTGSLRVFFADTHRIEIEGGVHSGFIGRYSIGRWISKHAKTCNLSWPEGQQGKAPLQFQEPGLQPA